MPHTLAEKKRLPGRRKPRKLPSPPGSGKGKPAPASRFPAQHDVLKLVGPDDRAKTGIQRFQDRFKKDYRALALVAANHATVRTK